MDTTQHTQHPTATELDELREAYRNQTGDNPPRQWVRADLVNYLTAARRDR